MTTVKIDLIEWYEDDVGQYADKGLPRSLDSFDVECDSEDDNALGDAVLGELSVKYKVAPVLACWSRI